MILILYPPVFYRLIDGSFQVPQAHLHATGRITMVLHPRIQKFHVRTRQVPYNRIPHGRKNHLLTIPVHSGIIRTAFLLQSFNTPVQQFFKRHRHIPFFRFQKLVFQTSTRREGPHVHTRQLLLILRKHIRHTLIHDRRILSVAHTSILKLRIVVNFKFSGNITHLFFVR